MARADAIRRTASTTRSGEQARLIRTHWRWSAEKFTPGEKATRPRSRKARAGSSRPSAEQSTQAAFGKILLAQFERRQAERFKAQDAARQASSEHWDQRFSGLEVAAKEWVRIKREWLEWKADLPMTYVMRDDYVRNQTVIEAKLDSVALRIENLQLKGIVK